MSDDDVDKFDLYDEQITEMLNNFMLSIEVIRGLNGGKKKMQMSQKPPDITGALKWYVGPDWIIKNNQYDYVPLLVVLNLECEIYASINKAGTTVKDVENFTKYLKSLGQDVGNELNGERYLVDFNNPDQLQEILRYMV